MKKHRSESGLDDAVNMDVMMDNMTDVAGTLLMVLIIVQLKVNQTIDQIQSSLPKVTQEESMDAQKEAAEQVKRVELAEADWANRKPEDTKIFEDLKVKQEDLRRHETTLQQNSVHLVALDEVKKQLAERGRQVETAKVEMSQLIAEREKLKGLLDDTPVPVAPPAKIVRMPSAREIPQGAELAHVLCANGRVYMVDSAKLKILAMKAFNKSRATLIKVPGPVTLGKDTNIYDHEKTAALLEKRSPGTADYELTFPIIRTYDHIHMQIRPKPSAGEAPDKFNSVRSQFASAVRRIKRNPKGVIWFLVYPDSFETYLAAREVCDRVGVPAGWELTGSPYFSEYLTDFLVNRLEEPPPPAPVDPTAIVIPAPKKTID